jgi:hypothetical protein
MDLLVQCTDRRLASYFQPFADSIVKQCRLIYAQYMRDRGSSDPHLCLEIIGPFFLSAAIARKGFETINRWFS